MNSILLLAAAWAASAQTADPIVEVHRCHFDAAVPEGSSTRASGHKYYRLDGTVYSMAASAELSGSGFFRPHGDGPHIHARLEWPGLVELLADGRAASLNWPKGALSISADLFTAAGRPRRGEEWQQVVVERDRRAVIIHTDGGTSTLFLSPLETHFVTGFEPVRGQFRLNSSLDRLIAWGMGAGRLTAFNVRVTRRRPRANTYPTDPAGQRRILFAYDIDVAALERAASEIRAAYQQWERTLAHSWRDCPRGQEGGVIAVTDAGISSPAARNSRSPRALPGRR